MFFEQKHADTLYMTPFKVFQITPFQTTSVDYYLTFFAQLLDYYHVSLDLLDVYIAHL